MANDRDIISYDARISPFHYKVELRTIDPTSFVNIYLFRDNKCASDGAACISANAARELAYALLELTGDINPQMARNSLAPTDFILAVMEGNQPKPTSKPRVMTSRKQANMVAQEMAVRHPGNTFAIYERVGHAFTRKPEPTLITLKD